MKIGFIGLGNMAKAMLEGMLNQGVVSPQEVVGSCKTQESAKKVAEKFGIQTYTDNRETAKGADYLFLAVKPQFFPQVIEEIKDYVGEETVIISIAAGKTIDFIQNCFGKKVKIIRCMPNTPALVGEGCTGYCVGEGVAKEQTSQVKVWLESFGKAYEVSEKLMDVVVGVSGSSPAYVFLFIEAMADQAVAEGMPRDIALKMASQAVLGSAKMVLETGIHPGQLKDNVCSPGGTTIQAVKVLEECGMRAAVMDAMEACIEKSRNL